MILPNWKSDKSGNHFTGEKKPGLSSTENSPPSNGSQESAIQPPTHFEPKDLKFWKSKNGKTIKIGDTVEVFVSEDEPNRRIKIEKISTHYKGDPTGGIEGTTPQGHWSWARISQVRKLHSGEDRYWEKKEFVSNFNKLSFDRKAKIIRDAAQNHEFDKASKNDKPIIHVDIESPLVMSNKYKDFNELPNLIQELIIIDYTPHGTGKLVNPV